MPEAHLSIIRCRRLVNGTVCLTICLVLAAGAFIWQLRNGELAESAAANHSLAVVLAEQTTRTFQAVDFVLQEYAEKIAADGINDMAALYQAYGTSEVHDALEKRLTDLPQAGSFGILDSQGRSVTQGRDRQIQGLSFADRSYFQHFRTRRTRARGCPNRSSAGCIPDWKRSHWPAA